MPSSKSSTPTVPARASRPGPLPGTPKVPGSGGSRKGIPNKATREFKETVTKLLQDNAENVALWLDRVANGTPPVYAKDGKTVLVPGTPGDPDKALQRLGHLAEFAAPKLTRAEVTGEGGGPVQVTVNRLA